MAGLADFLNPPDPATAAGDASGNGFSLSAIPEEEPAQAAPSSAAPSRVRQLGPNAQIAAQRMRKQFAEGRVQLPIYTAIYTALLHGVQSPEEVRLASDLADLAYLQWQQKQS